MELDLSATWTLELVACTLSVLALGAIAGVLAYSDGNVVLAWHRLTLNTVVSILGTLSKLSALFVLGAAIAQSKWAVFSRSPRSLLEFDAIEQAGRGVYGAAKLLYTTRRIAAIGAIACVLSVAFDPFIQQVVQSDQDLSWHNSTAAALPRSQRFSAGNRVPVQMTPLANLNTTHGSGDAYVNVEADFAVQSAALYGLIKPTSNVTQQLALSCPSGNCTWPATESLAVCSLCNDISSVLDQSHSEGWPAAVILDRSNAGAATGKLTRYTLPNGVYIDNVDDSDSLVQMMTFGTGNVDRTVSMTKVDTLIWAMTMLRLTEDQRNSRWPPSNPPEAVECALYYCVKEYHTTVNNSIINQNSSINLAAVRAADSWQLDAYETSDLDISESNKLTLEFDSRVSLLSRTDLMLGDGYNISQSAVDSISNWFQSNFADLNTTDRIPEVNGFLTGAFKSGNTVQYMPATIRPLFDSSDLGATFESLAESISNTIRADGDSKLYQSGTVGTPVTKYRVSWPWIALPVLVVLFTLIQLIATMWTSRHTPLWKSSSLATMSRGVYIGNFLEEASTVQEMEDVAKSQPVHLFSHTAPGGVAVVANANAVKKDGPYVSVVEMNDFSSTASPSAGTNGRMQLANESPRYERLDSC